MPLIVGELPRLPDALVNTGWVKELDVSNQGGGQQTSTVVGEKLQSLKGVKLDQVDLSKAIPLDPQFGENIQYDLDSSLVVKGRQDFVEFTDKTVSEKAQELAARMTEYPTGVKFSIDGLSMDQLAELFGNIGKDLDSAFAAGEISEQEYAELNKGLETYSAFMTEKSEQQKAAFAVMKQTAKATDAKIRSGASEQEMADYAAMVREKWQEKINEYLKEHSFDRTALSQMVAAIRGGTNRVFQIMA
ncbi:MAG TPA: hypothetical protein IAA83_09420 [Candidatus Avoscillospira avistercoris]|uniref:Uncharacterized protein n=1 Tax=Candidatus Avoscillospira avistercoris TaxID=2840707 RepID=A0A9D1JTU8_9FIRM|nr:hypothetical protein [Candidatus Avoscillospira avistercoris]